MLTGLIGLGAHEGKTTAQALTIKPELQVSVGKRVGDGDVLARREGATVPDLDRAGAVLALGYRPFEVSILKGVILGSHSEAAHPGIERGALGDGPADEDTFDLEAQVEMQRRAKCFWMTKRWEVCAPRGLPNGSGVCLKSRRVRAGSGHGLV